MVVYEPIEKLTRDLRNAAAILSDSEARFLVDCYYQMQDARIRSAGQVRSATAEPHEILLWFAEQNRVLENQIKGALDVYSTNHLVGEWLRSVVGIGPVIAAGFLAHIDIEQAPTAGHIWSFAGQVPGVKWGKGEKRPWNAKLKVLCWKAGESFVKTSSRENAFYGRIYVERKASEVAKNMAGDFSDQAVQKLKDFNIKKTTDAYKWYSGQITPAAARTFHEAIAAGRVVVPRLVKEGRGQPMLPPAHIHRRSTRYAVKLFLAHLHEVWYTLHFGMAPPLPYPIAILGHAHRIAPPTAD